MWGSVCARASPPAACRRRHHPRNNAGGGLRHHFHAGRRCAAAAGTRGKRGAPACTSVARGSAARAGCADQRTCPASLFPLPLPPSVPHPQSPTLDSCCPPSAHCWTTRAWLPARLPPSRTDCWRWRAGWRARACRPRYREKSAGSTPAVGRQPLVRRRQGRCCTAGWGYAVDGAAAGWAAQLNQGWCRTDAPPCPAEHDTRRLFDDLPRELQLRVAQQQQRGALQGLDLLPAQLRGASRRRLRDLVAAASTPRTLRAGDHLWQYGEEGSSLIILDEGEARGGWGGVMGLAGQARGSLERIQTSPTLWPLLRHPPLPPGELLLEAVDGSRELAVVPSVLGVSTLFAWAEPRCRVRQVRSGAGGAGTWVEHMRRVRLCCVRWSRSHLARLRHLLCLPCLSRPRCGACPASAACGWWTLMCWDASWLLSSRWRFATWR